jgi:hypothetical protein
VLWQCCSPGFLSSKKLETSAFYPVIPGKAKLLLGCTHCVSVAPLCVGGAVLTVLFVMQVIASTDPKPVPGDWSGNGAPVKFSTRETREEGKGWFVIQEHLRRLQNVSTPLRMQPENVVTLRGLSLSCMWLRASSPSARELLFFVLVCAVLQPGISRQSPSDTLTGPLVSVLLGCSVTMWGAVALCLLFSTPS